MRWPWVTRSRFEYEERHVKLLKTMLTEATEEAKDLRKAHDELVKTIVGMKREGFEPTPEIIELKPEEDLPKKIWEAINEVYAKGTREYYASMAYAHEALEAGNGVEEIVNRILYGQDVEV